MKDMRTQGFPLIIIFVIILIIVTVISWKSCSTEPSADTQSTSIPVVIDLKLS